MSYREREREIEGGREEESEEGEALRPANKSPKRDSALSRVGLSASKQMNSLIGARSKVPAALHFIAIALIITRYSLMPLNSLALMEARAIKEISGRARARARGR